MILPRISDENGQLWILVEDLLDATVVDALARVLLACYLIIASLLGIAEVFGVRDVGGRGVEIGVSAGRGRGIMLVDSYSCQ